VKSAEDGVKSLFADLADFLV